MEYEVLEHTADLKIRAYGKDLAELFSNLVKGMFEVCHPTIENKAIVSREIKISAKGLARAGTAEGGSVSPWPGRLAGQAGGKSSNLESLLVDFLSEVLYLSDINDEIYNKVEFNKLTETELSAKLEGNKIKKMEKEIKAVTWHDLEIKKIPEGWQATVLFDI